MMDIFPTLSWLNNAKVSGQSEFLSKNASLFWSYDNNFGKSLKTNEKKWKQRKKNEM